MRNFRLSAIFLCAESGHVHYAITVDIRHHNLLHHVLFIPSDTKRQN